MLRPFWTRRIRQRRRLEKQASFTAMVELLEDRTLLSASSLVSAELAGAQAFLVAVNGERIDPIAQAPSIDHLATNGVVESNPSANAIDGVVFSNYELSGLFVGAYTTGVIGKEDYDSINDADINLSQFKFVGGVQDANDELEFRFLNTSDVQVASFTFQFSSAGLFGYTIDLSGGPVTGVLDAGRIEVFAPSGSEGAWAYNGNAPSTGTENPATFGPNATQSYRFELSNTTTLPSGNPDLVPVFFGGWDGTIVISTQTGTNTDAADIQTSDTVYVDVGIGNFGDVSTSGTFTSEVRLDGNLVQTITRTTPVGVNQGFPTVDINLGQLSVGLHDVELSIDTTNAITENDETNNTTTKTLGVVDPANQTISGVKWNDIDGDGTINGSEGFLENWIIWLDLNDDGIRDGNEPFDTTDANGAWSITNVLPGTYVVREEIQAGWEQPSPGVAGGLDTDYQIDVNFRDNGMTPSQQAIFTQAADRWAEVITGDLVDEFVAGVYVDDLVIDAYAVPIDGVSGTLGRAAPTSFRSGSLLPTRGFMEFDTADIAALEIAGELFNTILHEMGHVLGIGTLWDDFALLTGAGTADPQFTGTEATAWYNAIFDNTPAEPSVPVANTGGAGTRDSHWRESVFQTEIMTGFLNGASDELSLVTVGSLDDLGYLVHYGSADVYQSPQSDPIINPPTDPPVVSIEADALTHLITVHTGETVTGVNFGNRLVITDDYGDAPSAAQSGFAASYPVTLAEDGARHTPAGPTLGPERDIEPDGVHSDNANADDLDGSPDDEDGIVFTANLVASATGPSVGIVDVNLQNPDGSSNRLDAWIDFNQDGDWKDPGEQIFSNFSLGTVAGVQTLNFMIPQDTGTNVLNGKTYARFRVSTAGSLGDQGAASDGEVEDHTVIIADSTVPSTFDFGTAASPV
ncbi:MAG: hypothetical protein KDA93_13925, partial [Planctomycetaceae bacterium]|nr:hypothetical protein [Planctomycetaceae bacterium]